MVDRIRPLYKFAGKVASILRGVPVFPAIVLSIFVILGLFGRFIAPHDPLAANFSVALTPPFWQDGGTREFLLGTDTLGRDVLSRLIVGAAVPLQVGLVVVLVAGGIGTVVGILSGFIGGRVDTISMRIADMMLSMPFMMVAIVLAATMGPSLTNVSIVLVLLYWARYARVLRSEVLRISESDFIKLAIVAGASKARIMVRHIFPNIVNTLIIMGTIYIGMVIIAEAALSFLGVGVPPPQPAWGSMLAEGRNYITYAWWLTIWPGMCILLVVLSCNLLGDWLRGRLDPKRRQV